MPYPPAPLLSLLLTHAAAGAQSCLTQLSWEGTMQELHCKQEERHVGMTLLVMMRALSASMMPRLLHLRISFQAYVECLHPKCTHSCIQVHSFRCMLRKNCKCSRKAKGFQRCLASLYPLLGDNSCPIFFRVLFCPRKQLSLQTTSLASQPCQIGLVINKLYA